MIHLPQFISNMPDSFRFKQFSIRQDASAMKIGTDSVLLGSWVNIENVKSILDIGTGTGLLALMMAQRNHSALVIGVEKEPAAFKEACYNANASKWSDRIHIEFDDIRKYTSNIKFDAIITNPPFFNEGIRPQIKERTDARHTSSLSFKDLIMTANNLLTPSGTFHVIIPKLEFNNFIELAQSEKFYINRQLTIRPHVNKPEHRVLLSLTRFKKEYQTESLSLHEVGSRSYSESYISLTKDFYLYM